VIRKVVATTVTCFAMPTIPVRFLLSQEIFSEHLRLPVQIGADTLLQRPKLYHSLLKRSKIWLDGPKQKVCRFNTGEEVAQEAEDNAHDNVYFSFHPEWNYHPSAGQQWSEIFPLCGGSSQSPINIDEKTVKKSARCAPLHFVDGLKRPSGMSFQNRGHVLKDRSNFAL
jgi:Eukaryotic-type carbonic anhydrase